MHLQYKIFIKVLQEVREESDEQRTFLKGNAFFRFDICKHFNDQAINIFKQGC